MREKLLAAVQARTEETIETGDSRPVLAPDAIAEANALLARVLGPAAGPGEPLDLEVLHAVGWLYWLRVEAMSPDEDYDDLQTAMLVLQPVHASDPEAVPELLRTFYAEQTPPRKGQQRRGKGRQRRGKGQQRRGKDRQRRDQVRRADPAAYTDQGAELYEWYLQSGDLDALQAAVRTFRAALAAVPDQHPKRGLCLSNLHTAVHSLAERTGDANALQEAVSVGRDLLEVTAESDPEYARRVGHVGIVLRSLSEHTGDVNTLWEAVRLVRAGLAATPDGDPDRAGHLSHLGGVLQLVYEHTGDLDALREALTAGQAAVAAMPADDPDRATCLSNLAATLQAWFDQTGDLASLREAVAAGRAAAEATTDSDSGRAAPLTNLGGALQLLYEHTGDLDTLREAVTAGRAATAAAPDGRPNPVVLANLGVSLRVLFEHTGDLDVLREAVVAHRGAVAATSDEHPNRASRLTNLGNTLRAAYDRTGDLNALRDSVTASRAAVAATPDGHPLRAANLSGLGNGLFILFEQTDDLDTLREAIAASQDALTATPADHSTHGRHQSNVGIGLCMLFERTDDLDTLREAIAASRAAVAVTPDGHPELANYLSALGTALRRTFERTGDQQALSEARAALARAARLPTAAVADRIHAGQRQAQIEALAGDHPSALAAMETVVSLLPQTAARELRRADRAHRLGEVAGIGAGAAAAALSAGQPSRAVELLERARGLLLAETMDARTDQARLRAHAPDLADQFTRLRDHLANLETAPSPRAGELIADPPDITSAHRLADQRREAATEWNTLLERIRARPELGDFLTPPPIDRLQPQAKAGPIVIVSTDPSRCDALILTTDSDQPVRHIPLTDLTHATVYEQANRFLQARQMADTATSLTESEDAQSILHEILAWLWDTTTGPILADLGYTSTPEASQPWPRLWWGPVGAMTLLPLHAAGHHHDIVTGAPQPRTVLDRVASSYTATIRALAYARQALTSPHPTTPRPPALIVAMPDTPGATSLPGVSNETRRLTSLLPGATVLRGHRATHQAVVAALPVHSVAHFACHGLSEWTAPDTSRLLLHDHTSHPLTVTALSRLHLTDADLAYLSACSTTDTHPNLADEAVHITAAFQLAGYRNVIGTLWPIDDETATRIAIDVYTRLTDHGTHPPHTDQAALALHHAVRHIRTDYLATPTHWSAHIHTGM